MSDDSGTKLDEGLFGMVVPSSFRKEAGSSPSSKFALESIIDEAARDFGRRLDRVFQEIMESVTRELTYQTGLTITFNTQGGRWIDGPRFGDWREYELRTEMAGTVRVSEMDLAASRPSSERVSRDADRRAREEPVEMVVPTTVMQDLQRANSQLRTEVALYKSREKARDNVLQAQNEELAKLRGATGESGLIQRLQLKLRTQYGDKERAVLKDFFVWLIEEKQARFPDEKKVDPNAVYSELVSGIRIAPDRAIEVEVLLDEYLDSMEQKD